MGILYNARHPADINLRAKVKRVKIVEGKGEGDKKDRTVVIPK